MISKLKIMYNNIMYVSKITRTRNKKIRILLTVFLANGVAAVDILLILVFSSVITNIVDSDNILGIFLEFFLQNKYLIPLLVLARFIFVYIQSINMKLLEFDINRNLKVKLLDEVFDKSNYSVSDAYFYVNELTSHLTFFYTAFATFLMSVIQIIAYGYYLVVSDINTLIYFMGGIVILYFPLRTIISKSRKFIDEAYWKQQSLSTVIEKVVENMFLIKILKKDKEEIFKFDSDLRDFNDVSIKHIIWTSASGYLPTFITMFVLGVLVSFSNIIKGLTIDFIGVTLRLFQQFGALAGSINNLLNSQVHIKHFTNLEKNKVSINKNNYVILSHIDENTAIKLENISFKYFNSDDYIFKEIDLSIPINTHTIITGPNGSGKSTLLGLISGVLYSESGLIKINSSKLGYIGATPFIFNDTLRENLLYGNEHIISDKILMKKLKEFETFREESAYDLDRVVTNKSLSSGQMQKIAFIRALIAGVEILLLDESTSNLDDKMKKLIFDILSNETNLTIVNSTHDPNSFEDASNHIKIEIEDEKRYLNSQN